MRVIGVSLVIMENMEDVENLKRMIDMSITRKSASSMDSASGALIIQFVLKQEEGK